VVQINNVSVDVALDESIDLGLNLPVHMRCAAQHTLNLIGTTDAGNKALENDYFQSIYRKAMARATACGIYRVAARWRQFLDRSVH